MAFHPDGARLAIADYRTRRTSTSGTSPRARVITHPGPRAVSCVEFTPDGKRLAALGYDGDVHLADARTGDEVLVLRTFGPPAGGGGHHAPDGLQPRRLPDRRQRHGLWS